MSQTIATVFVRGISLALVAFDLPQWIGEPALRDSTQERRGGVRYVQRDPDAWNGYFRSATRSSTLSAVKLKPDVYKLARLWREADQRAEEMKGNLKSHGVN
jgi:hypothetical protein